MSESVEVLDVAGLTFGDAVGVVARWLASSREAEVTDHERGMLEVLVTDVQRLLDGQSKTNDSIAQVQAANQTIEAQLCAPKPSRRVLRWAVSTISAYTVGLASGATLNYLPELVKLLH